MRCSRKDETKVMSSSNENTQTPAADGDEGGDFDWNAPPQQQKQEQSKRNPDIPAVVIKNQEEELPTPSMSVALFVYWIVPILIIAVVSRFAVYDGPAIPPVTQSRSINVGASQGSSTLNMKDMRKENKAAAAASASTPSSSSSATSSGGAPSVAPGIMANKPTSYQDAVHKISKRRLDWSATNEENYALQQQVSSSSSTSTTTSSQTASSRSSRTSSASQQQQQHQQQPSTPTTPTGLSNDPARQNMQDAVDNFRRAYQAHPNDIFKGIELADALRLYDVQFHDGGTMQEEAISTYETVIQQVWEQREEKLNAGESVSTVQEDINEEIVLEYQSRSYDGILCALYCGLGKTFFMANMFEKAVESYTKCLDDIDGSYLDAISSRGSSLIILGKYEEAARDFLVVLEKDTRRRFQDIFTGLSRILQAKEEAVPGGWDPVLVKLNEMIPLLEMQYESMENPQAKNMIASSLNRFYHCMFLYHDSKTKDVDAAWENLTKSYKHKMSTIAPWNKGFESSKISATKKIFHEGFWPEGVGSQSKVPVFVIGFVRSGSTLLERVLDAHPQIVGTGENSVFNGRLDTIRNKIVEASMLGDSSKLAEVISTLADGVVDEMRDRHKMALEKEGHDVDELSTGAPQRYVDKMLTNYYNVGFIHMLFPNALILHVAREPMDTIFSAYKHEFPPGTLDYTSEFESLAELYHAYRDLIEHWDKELPGRITHVRYEDLVNDMPNTARRIIHAAGLDWDEGVLDFHKKKHAVNTLSTTQVRKGIYKDSLQAWRKYEKHLQPLVELIGDRTFWNLETTLPLLTQEENNERLQHAADAHNRRNGSAEEL